MATAKKKTATKKKAPTKKKSEPRLKIDPISGDLWERFEKLVKRMSETPDFEIYVLMLRDMAAEVRNAKFNEKIISDHALTIHYNSIEYLFETQATMFEEILSDK